MVGEEVERILHDAASANKQTNLADLPQLGDPRLLYGAPFAYSRNLLHVATMCGQESLVKEVLEKNPRLARGLDSQKSSPLHIAAADGSLEIATRLIAKAPETCWWRDAHDMNPIHIAAMNGHEEVLKVLLEVSHLPAMERLPRGQTVLHLCVKHCNLAALKVLVEKLDQILVQARDKNGETVLDLAVRSDQLHMIKYLVEEAGVNKESMNSMKKTARYILKQSPPGTTSSEITKLLRGRMHMRRFSSEEMMQRSDALMVVAVLTATMAFQSAISPPGGVWQQDNDDMPYKAGDSVMASTHPTIYKVFLVVNTGAFVLSLMTILILSTQPSMSFSQGLTLSYAVFMSQLSILASYAASLIVITPTMDQYFLHPIAYIGVGIAVLITLLFSMLRVCTYLFNKFICN